MINKDQFYELPQLDRIEFRQKRETIFNSYKTYLLGRVLSIWLFVYVVGSLFIGLSFGGAKMVEFMLQFEQTSTLIGIAGTIIIAFIGDAYSLIKRNKEIIELHQEFFDFEVKIKKSKNGRKK